MEVEGVLKDGFSPLKVEVTKMLRLGVPYGLLLLGQQFYLLEAVLDTGLYSGVDLDQSDVFFYDLFGKELVFGKVQQKCIKRGLYI